jgi:hypothetical protein
MILACFSALCLFLSTAVSGDASECDSSADSSTVRPDVTPDSVASTFSLGVDGEGECGPPLLQVGRYAVRGSIFPGYHQKYGLAVKLGFSILDDRNRRLVLGTVYSLREDRFYLHQSLMIPLRASGQSTLHLHQWLSNRDGRRSAGMGLRWATSRSGGDASWFTAALSLSLAEYYTLRSLPVSIRPPGRAVAVSGQIHLDVGRVLSEPIPAFAATVLLTQSVRALGGGNEFSQVEWAGTLRLPQGWLWASGGWSRGRVPAQYRFDLAQEGQVQGQPLWLWLGEGYRAAGISAHVRVYGVAHGVGFVTRAKLAGPGPEVTEAGVGMGLSHGGEERHPDWKLRIDFPFFSSVSRGVGPDLDVCRVAVRVWFWPAQTAFKAPDSDCRCVGK